MNFIQPDYYVYTDGSCSNNGRVGACSGIGIYFGENDPRNVSQRILGKQTNNTAELRAIIDAYKIIEIDVLSGKRIIIVSDSEYAIKCVGSYGKKCSDDGWKKDMPNKELVKQVYELYKGKINVSFMHIMAHTGRTDIHSIGNDGADKLANLAVGISSGGSSSGSIGHVVRDEKIYLAVPFATKDIAKGMGAKWDPSKKKWYTVGSNPNKDALVQQFGR
jgi:ribonuclease HI